MNTKEKIIDEALTLFSTRGYEGVSVKDIAGAVGIKDSSLCKHFKSKREIFDTIITNMAQRMEQIGRDLDLPDAEHEDSSLFYGEITTERLLDITKRAFLFYLEDSYIARFRRMISIEQYHNSEASGMYRKIFMEDSITYQMQVFKQLSDSGVFVTEDSEVIALYYYSPIFFLLNKYDNKPELREEALQMLEKHVVKFRQTFRA